MESPWHPTLLSLSPIAENALLYLGARVEPVIYRRKGQDGWVRQWVSRPIDLRTHGFVFRNATLRLKGAVHCIGDEATVEPGCPSVVSSTLVVGT